MKTLSSVPSLKQVRYFVEVARMKSLNAAARQLNVSQPAVGLQINLLEEVLGCLLFQRHARGVELTRNGKLFLDYAQRALDVLQEGVDSLQITNRREPEIQFGVTPSAGRVINEDLVVGGLATRKRLRLVVRQAVSDVLLRQVRSGELDASTCFYVDDASISGLAVVPLYQEDLVLIGPPHLTGKGKGAMKASQLEQVRLALGFKGHGTRRLIDALASQRGVKLDIALEVEPVSLTFDMMSRNGLCTIGPLGLYLSDVQEGRLKARPISPSITRTLVLLMNGKLAQSVQTRLTDILRESIDTHIATGASGWRSPQMTRVLQSHA